MNPGSVPEVIGGCKTDTGVGECVEVFDEVNDDAVIKSSAGCSYIVENYFSDIVTSLFSYLTLIGHATRRNIDIFVGPSTDFFIV